MGGEGLRGAGGDETVGWVRTWMGRYWRWRNLWVKVKPEVEENTKSLCRA